MKSAPLAARLPPVAHLHPSAAHWDPSTNPPPSICRLSLLICQATRVSRPPSLVSCLPSICRPSLPVSCPSSLIWHSAPPVCRRLTPTTCAHVCQSATHHRLPHTYNPLPPMSDLLPLTFSRPPPTSSPLPPTTHQLSVARHPRPPVFYPSPVAICHPPQPAAVHPLAHPPRPHLGTFKVSHIRSKETEDARRAQAIRHLYSEGVNDPSLTLCVCVDPACTAPARLRQ